jgi:very-short-patch-repair endonuclease
MLRYNKRLAPLARELRKNMTDAEKLGWSKVSRRQIAGYQFYRQRIIEDYIVDFYCPTAKLVVKIDGGQHYSGEGKQGDELRDKSLGDLGLKVLRFSNLEVLQNIDGVLEHIFNNIKSYKQWLENDTT